MIGELADHLWQSTAFAVFIAVLTMVLRKNLARVRYWLWLSASLKFFVPFALLIALGSRLEWAPVAQRIATPALSSAVVQISQPFVEGWPSNVPSAASTPSTPGWPTLAILAVWMCGVGTIGVLRWRTWRQIRAVVRASAPLLSHTEIPAGVRMRSSPGLLEPGVVGLWRHILLLPEDLETHLTRPQFDAIIAHELSHIRRRDNLTSAMHMVTEALFWFHPLVWWIGARLLEERERACDEDVLRTFGEPHAYAEGILIVCKRYVEAPIACVSGVSGWNLEKRIDAILSNRIGNRLTIARKVLLASVAIAVFALPVLVGAMDMPPLLAHWRPASLGSPLLASPDQISRGVALGIRSMSESIVPSRVDERSLTSAPLAARVVAPALAAVQAAPSVIPTFDVVSVKPCVPGQRGGGAGGRGAGPRGGGPGGGGPGGPIPGRLQTPCMPLEMFIRQAYYSRGTLPAHSPLEKAPDWIESERFQIIATAEGNPSIEMMRGPMLRAVLEDRFKLKVHRETRDIPIYVLTVGPRGPKLYPWVESADCVSSLPSEWPAPPRKPACGIRPRTGPNAIPTPAVWSGQRGSNRYFDLFPATLEEFAWNIGAFLDRPVVDKTGIAGFFDLHIEFSPDGTILPPSLPDDPPSAPSFFTAMQEQLGLKLEPSRGPYDFFVIDSIDRLVEN